MAKARYDYVSEGRDPETHKYRRSAGDILKNTALGFLRGVGTGNGLAGGVGGALTRGIAAGISPRLGREALFEETVRPGLEQDAVEAQKQIALRRQVEEQALGDEYRRAQIGELNRRSLPEAPKQPPLMNTPRGVFDPASRTMIPDTGPLPAPPRELHPSYKYDVDELPYNINNPAERKKYESLPRSKRVKPEKATGPAKPKEKPKYVPLSKIREYAKQRGISRDAAEAEAKADGYTVIR